MKSRHTFRLFVAACLLGGVIWFLNQTVLPTDKSAELATLVLPDYSVENVVSLMIERGELRADCVRKDSTWYIQHPITARADPAAVMRILNEIEALRKNDIITADQRAQRELTLKDYGFDNPQARLIIGGLTGRKAILFGCEAQLGKSLYLKLGDSDDVIATSDTILEAIPAKLEGLRDRIIVHGEVARTSRVEIQGKAGGFIQLMNKGRGWSIQQPEVARADTEKVSQMLTALYALKACKFVADPLPSARRDLIVTNTGSAAVAEPSAKVEPYGLTDEAAVRVTVWVKGDELGRGIALGKPTGAATNEVYAKAADSDSIYAVDGQCAALFSVTVNDLKDRNLYPIEPEFVKGIVFQEGDQKVALARVPETGWFMVEPGRWKADEHFVNELIRRITHLRIESFSDSSRTNLAELGLSPPAYTVQIQSDKAAQAGLNTNRLLIGKLAEGASTLFVKFENENAICGISADSIKGMETHPADPLACRDRTMLAVQPENVKRITLTKAGVEQTVIRDTNGTWIAVAPSTNRINAAVVEEALFAVSNLRAIRIESNNPNNVASYGLERGATSLTLGLSGEEGIQKTILMGFLAKGGKIDGIYAMVYGYDVVFVLDKNIVDRMVRDLTEPIQAAEGKKREGDAKEPIAAQPPPGK